MNWIFFERLVVLQETTLNRSPLNERFVSLSFARETPFYCLWIAFRGVAIYSFLRRHCLLLHQCVSKCTLSLWTPFFYIYFFTPELLKEGLYFYRRLVLVAPFNDKRYLSPSFIVYISAQVLSLSRQTVASIFRLSSTLSPVKKTVSRNKTHIRPPYSFF